MINEYSINYSANGEVAIGWITPDGEFDEVTVDKCCAADVATIIANPEATDKLVMEAIQAAKV